MPPSARKSTRRAPLAVALVVGVLVATAGACSNEGDTTTATTIAPSSTTTEAPTTPTSVLDLTTTTLPGPGRVDVATTPLGPVLVDGDGLTLYAFVGDTPAAIGCIGTCLQAWPPLLATSVVAGPELDPTTFTLTARPDVPAGSTGGQVTAAGRPLYRFTGDARPGETIGQGFNRTWFVVRPDGTLLDPTATTTTTAVD